MGTSEFAVPALRAVAAGFDVVAVVTRPDRPRGRGQVMSESPVGRAAVEIERPILKPARPSDEPTLEALRRLAPDLFAVVAFGSILTAEMLSVPRLGSINLHGSLLPEYRGAAPVQRALWDGRTGSGVTTLWMDAGIDTGDVILQRWEPIRPEDDAGTLGERLAALGAPLLAESLRLAARDAAPRVPQLRGSGSYAPKLAKGDGIVDWKLDAEVVWNRQRAVTPWPGASSTLRGKPVLLTQTRPLHRLDPGAPPGTIVGVEGDGVVVACAASALQILELKPEGRSEMTGAAWARGARPAAGERFGAEVSA
jgi:methionyl-tRNA formyltransferase